MKLIVYSKGNINAGDPDHFSYIYKAEVITIESDQEGYWLNIWNDGESYKVDYDPSIDTLYFTE